MGCEWGLAASENNDLRITAKDLSCQPKERIVEAVVVVELGVKGGGDLVAVAHGYRCVVQGDEGLDASPQGFDARGADEGEGDGFIFPVALGVEAAELAAVGVAADGDGQGAEMVGQKNETGAGAEDG